LKKASVFVIALILIGSLVSGQQPGSTPGVLPSIESVSGALKKFPGYFPFYWDETSGRVLLEVDKLDQEFLYVSSLPAGLGSNDIGLDRVQLGRTRVVKFQRFGPKVLLTQVNYEFRAHSQNPDERKDVEDAFAKSVLFGFQCVAADGNRVLIDLTPFILQDAQNAVGTLRRARQGVYRLDTSRSAVYTANTKNFPKNSEFEAVLTFTADEPGNYIRDVAPDPSSITLREHHSFIELPDNAYKPRLFDPRSNFGDHTYMDFATPFTEPLVKRVTSRFRLNKKDPSAKVSEPVKPIVYYVDRGAPEPIRSALVEGGNWWNQAFEAIGYKNAFRVEVMPEAADPLDVRINVVNWIHRSTRGWSYGGGITDPRTGEILKGHVALGSQRIRQDYLIAESLIADYLDGKKTVTKEAYETALLRIKQLSAHEIGHTLGMGHNYAASVNDRASVMDYPHPLIKITPDGKLDFSDTYPKGIGEWDKVSIAFAYQDYPAGTDEDKESRAILDRAFSRGLYFLDSSDAGPASAHPLAATWDNGKNPVDELERVMKIRAIGLKSFGENRIRMNMPIATLEELLVPLYLFHRYQVEAAASALGGQYYYHKLRGDTQKNPEIVPPAEQKRALAALLETVRPEFLSIDEKILSTLPPRPPGYPQTRELFPGYTGSTFDPLAAAETAAGLTMEMILLPERASRLVDFHSRNAQNPGLGETIDAVLNFTWKSGKKTGILAEVQRVVDYAALLNLMKLAANESASPQARAIAHYKINELKKWLFSEIPTIEDEDLKAHFYYGITQIDAFQKDPAKMLLQKTMAIPPGAPIGG